MKCREGCGLQCRVLVARRHHCLTEKLHFDYSYLSSIFSNTEGKSIQKYQNKVKVERIKELLEYDELSISEFTNNLRFGSAAYLSPQFKNRDNQSLLDKNPINQTIGRCSIYYKLLRGF